MPSPQYIGKWLLVSRFVAGREVASCGHPGDGEELLALWWGLGAGGSQIKSECLFSLCFLMLS